MGTDDTGDTLDGARILVAGERTLPDDRPHAVGVLQRLCRAAAGSLPASGVAISVVSPAGGDFAVAASDPAHEVIEELQFTVGEGPCLAAFRSGGPVLTSDLADATRSRWPGYGAAAHDLGVRAVFAFPLQVGATRLGALDVYQDRAGRLSAQATTRALLFAKVAVETLLDTRLDRQGDTDAGGVARTETADDALEPRLEVYQAQGMVMIQLGVPLDEAMSRLRAFAYVHDRQLTDVASDVVARRLSLDVDMA